MNNDLIRPFRSDFDKHWISLSKLVGKQVVDIVGYISNPLGGGSSFHIFKVIFDDGTFVFVEGEHNYAYIETVSKQPMPHLDDDEFMDAAYADGEEVGEE